MAITAMNTSAAAESTRILAYVFFDTCLDFLFAVFPAFAFLVLLMLITRGLGYRSGAAAGGRGELPRSHAVTGKAQNVDRAPSRLFAWTGLHDCDLA